MEEKIPQLTLTPDLGKEPVLEPVKEEDLIEKAEKAPEAGPDLSMLSAAEQQAVLAFSEQIDLTDSSQVLQYGAAAQKNIADFSQTALSKVQTRDLGEIGDMVTSLVVELKGMESRLLFRQKTGNQASAGDSARSLPEKRDRTILALSRMRTHQPELLRLPNE